MSPQPSLAPAPSPVTAFLLGNRRAVAYALLALAAASFAAGVYLFAKTFQSTAVKKADESGELVKPVEARADDALRLGNSETLLGGFGTLTLAAVLGAAGVITLVSLPKPTAAAREADARKALVLFGGLTGLTLTVIGFAFCVEWYRYLGEWLDTKTPPPGAYRFVLALLVFVGGAGLAFLSAQPARADERDNPQVRRLIFGMNLGLSTFLLLVLLVVGNILVTLKVPNKLDTTAGGLYSLTLSEPTTDYLASLSTPVAVYTTIPDEGVGADVHRLLDACRERNPQMVTVKYLSRVLDKQKVAELRASYAPADFNDDGLLITSGRDEERKSYVRGADLVNVPDARSQDGPPRAEFVGESKLMRELLFLSDDKKKPVVYFTTGHGEIEVVPAGPGEPPAAGPRRAATTAYTTLTKSYVDLRPLRFELANPAVPADASMLVIADPTGAFTAAEVAALKAYLSAPASASGKSGKVILIAGPHSTPDRKQVVDIGLDGLLSDYGITLGRKYILNRPTREFGYLDTLTVMTAIADQQSPLAREFGGREPRGFVFPLAREVIVTAAANPASRAEPLLVTYPSGVTWLESEYPVNPARMLEQMSKDRELLVAKEVERGGRRAVAAIVTEGDKGKLAVFGSGAAFLDDDPREPHGAEASAYLLSVTVNWLREQPSVANIAAKSYGFYSPDRKLDVFRAGVLPVLMASLLTAALGVGVWIVRRK